MRRWYVEYKHHACATRSGYVIEKDDTTKGEQPGLFDGWFRFPGNSIMIAEDVVASISEV